jgi:hypothetical protein
MIPIKETPQVNSTVKNTSTIKVNKWGDKQWFREDGKLHREDGPAIELANGDKQWWVNGKLHRDDGPAFECLRTGYKEWWIKGNLHREDGPAVARLPGDDGKVFGEWYQDGRLHREGGPAIEYSTGYKAWYKNGKRHRLDGPAIEGCGGEKSWWLNNVLQKHE